MWRWDQAEPFGVSTPDENPSGLGVFEFPLRFSGQYSDKETNLSYNYYRDYAPSLGRYMQSDPIGLRAGINIYQYVLAQPLTATDPYGLKSWSWRELVPLLERLIEPAGEKAVPWVSDSQRIGIDIGKQLCAATGGRFLTPYNYCGEHCSKASTALQTGWTADAIVECTSACEDEFKKCKPKPSASICNPFLALYIYD